MFQTKYKRNDISFCPNGSVVIESPVYDDHGAVVDYEVENLDAYIQSNVDSGNVALILERYAVTGDDTLLNSSPGFYGDVSNVQGSTLHDRHYNYQAAVDLYESMPDGVKDLYPTVEEFYDNFSDDKIGAVFHSALETIDDIPLEKDGDPVAE